MHSFAPFPAHTIEEVIDGNIVTTSQPLLPIDVSRNAGYYLTLKGTIKYYPRKHRKSGSSLAVNGSRDTTPLEYLNLVDPAIEAMEKAVDDKVKDDTERVWKQDVQKQADEGYFTAQVEKLRDSGNPLIRRAMDLVDAAGEADNLALEMQRMEEIHPDLIESSNALTYQISQRNFRFSLQSPGRGFNIGITRVHKPLLDELYHVEIS
ncbi:MAG: hypothetical protein HYV40_03895, partial [Candidatus Levybacteria bacterium]|nr:hypothetical protein [Candidatus Levybacteria bacterium]